MLLTFAWAAALASTQPPPAAAAAVLREHAFAAAARERGMAAAFLEFIDPDAVRLTPEPQPALPFWKARANRLGPPYLEWRPIWAGGSRCGHLAFTLGPYRYGGQGRGWYFTVWGDRGSDVPLRWMLDAGLELPSAPPVVDDAPVEFAAAATGRWRDAHMDAYEAQITQRDQQLNVDIDIASPRTYSSVLAPDARALGPGPEGLATGAPAVLVARTLHQPIAAHHRGTIADSCGDLGFSYGVAVWTEAGERVTGSYVRVWRRDGERWTLLFDELVPAD